MDWGISLTLAIGVMLILFFAGLPVFVSFLIINILGIAALVGSAGFGMFANSIYQSVTNGSLTAVALFILMGEILFRSGTIDTLIDSIDQLVGRLRSRDYVVISLLSVVFGALCGSTVAVAALMGKTIMPVMENRGYDTRLTAGAIVGGATLAAIIPPSLIVIIVGSQVEVSIASLLISGILPGLVLSSLILGYTYIRIYLNPGLEPPARGEKTAREPFARRAAILRISPFFLVIFFVMGLILLGVATPSESAATGVLGAILTALTYRRFSLKMLRESLVSATKINAMILIIVASSKLFGELMSFVGASAGLMHAATRFDLSAGAMFLVLMAVPFVLCMFIDLIAVMLVAIPIYLPVVKAYAFDPTWFWMLFIINLAIGAITPPFGYTLFALKGAYPIVSLQDIYAGAWPIVMVFVAGMILMFFVPSIITGVPGLF